MYQILIVAEDHYQIVCTLYSSHACYYMWSVSLLHPNTLSLYRAEDSASSALNKLHYLDLNILLLWSYASKWHPIDLQIAPLCRAQFSEPDSIEHLIYCLGIH